VPPVPQKKNFIFLVTGEGSAKFRIIKLNRRIQVQSCDQVAKIK
jgi:hypothetical protein